MGTLRLALMLLAPALALAVESGLSAHAQAARQLTALVTVVARSAAPVAGLSAADFVILEGGAKREVVAATPASDPLFVSLLVDTTKPRLGTQAPVPDLRASLASLVRTIRAHEPSASISLGEFAGAAVTTVAFEAGGERLDEAIARLYPNHPSDGVLLEGLIDAARSLQTRPTSRRAIVSIDLHSAESSNDRIAERAMAEVQKSGATYWAVSVRGLNRSDWRRDSVLDSLTKVSGGMRLTAAAPSGLEALLTQVAASLLSQYEVTFARPANEPPGTLRAESPRGHTVLVSSMKR